jgi:hypothetical protein
MRYFPIKSVLLKGRIQQSVTYKLCPGTEFSEGVWNLSLLSLTYSVITSDQTNKEVFSISCNQVKGHQFSSSNEVESYNQPLSTFIVDHKLKTKNVNFEKLWFHINSISNELKFSFKNESNEAFEYDCEIYLQVLFQRIM